MEEKKVTNTAEKVIVIKELYKAFEGRAVLNGIDLFLQKGENLAVLGKSGSGKSVLIKMISGLLKPDSGTVEVLGKNVNAVSEKELMELRLQIGFSFQNSALYDSMSVKENLAFPLVRNKRNLSKKEVNDTIEAVLNDVGLLNTIDQMPSELSGGQKKRIGIARTLILKPQIMLYDEPTAGLDPVTCMEINTLIKKVQQEYKTSSIIITHDLTCAKNTADRIAMLVDGKFVTTGPFDDVFAEKESVARSFYDYNFITTK